MARPRKYTPATFAAAYAPLKAKGLSNVKIAEAMGITDKTLRRMLADPTFQPQTTVLIPREEKKIVEAGDERAEKVLAAAYNLALKGISDNTNKAMRAEEAARSAALVGDKERAKEQADMAEQRWEEARIISLQSLQIARTSQDVKRVVQAMTINLDARTQSLTINNVPPSVKAEISSETINLFVRELWERASPALRDEFEKVIKVMRGTMTGAGK